MRDANAKNWDANAGAAELLAKCQARDIALQALGGQLNIDAPAGELTPELLHALRTRKAELLELLAGGSPGSHDDHGDAGQAHGEASEADGSQDLAEAPRAMAGQAEPRARPTSPVAVEWPAAAADFALLLTVDDFPPAPFHLNPWTRVLDTTKLLTWLRADIRRGPAGPRAFYGALQADLVELRRFALAAGDERQNGTRS